MIFLRPMGQAEYLDWRSRSARDYAQEKVRVGAWPPEQALDMAIAEFEQFLPEGTKTPGHHILCVVDSGSDLTVGEVWLSEQDGRNGPELFIFDFSIHEPYRRRGFGLAAMRAVELEALRLGLSKISLHVFGGNEAAKALYEKAGFVVTDYNMTRRLDRPPDLSS